MLEEKCLALEYLTIKRKNESALDREEYLAMSYECIALTSQVLTILDSGCLIHTCNHTQGGKGFTCDPAASEVFK